MLPKFVLTNLDASIIRKSDAKQFSSAILMSAVKFNKSIQEHQWIWPTDDLQLLQQVYQAGELFVRNVVPKEWNETAEDSLNRMFAAAQPVQVQYCGPYRPPPLIVNNSVSIDGLKYMVENWRSVFPNAFIMKCDQDFVLLYLATIVAFSKHDSCTTGMLMKLRHVLLQHYLKDFADLKVSLVKKIWTEYGAYVTDDVVRSMYADFKSIVPAAKSDDLWNAVSQIVWCEFVDYKLVTDCLQSCPDFPWSRLARIVPQDFADYARVARVVGNRPWCHFDRSTSEVADVRFPGLTYCAEKLFLFSFGEEMLPCEVTPSLAQDVDSHTKNEIHCLIGWYVFERMQGRQSQMDDTTLELRAFVDALPDLEDAQLEYDSVELPEISASQIVENKHGVISVSKGTAVASISTAEEIQCDNASSLQPVDDQVNGKAADWHVV